MLKNSPLPYPQPASHDQNQNRTCLTPLIPVASRKTLLTALWDRLKLCINRINGIVKTTES